MISNWTNLLVTLSFSRVRMHYGHPDVFDRIFHITRGGISKASRVINISEDIYAGFNSTLRQGNITHHEYIQVGKGRDVGLNQIALFEGKVAGGNGEQVLSRDVYRLGQLFDFFRMLTFFFTTVGYYVCTMVFPTSFPPLCCLCIWVYFMDAGFFCSISCVYWVLSVAS
jgi:callose synthase